MKHQIDIVSEKIGRSQRCICECAGANSRLVALRLRL